MNLECYFMQHSPLEFSIFDVVKTILVFAFVHNPSSVHVYY